MYVINGKGSIIRLISGVFVLVSSVLAFFLSHYWLILSGLVGANLIISFATGFCPLEILLEVCGMEVRGVSAPLRKIDIRNRFSLF